MIDEAYEWTCEECGRPIRLVVEWLAGDPNPGNAQATAASWFEYHAHLWAHELGVDA